MTAGIAEHYKPNLKNWGCIVYRENQALKVYFDGSCPLCSAEISHYPAQIGTDEICFRDVSKDDLAPESDLSKESAMC